MYKNLLINKLKIYQFNFIIETDARDALITKFVKCLLSNIINLMYVSISFLNSSRKCEILKKYLHDNVFILQYFIFIIVNINEKTIK